MSIVDYSYFVEFPPEICELKHLTKLHFTDDNIWELRSKRMNPADVILPENIGNLKNLEELFLPGNGISTLPNSIGNLRNLKILNLESNGINDFPESFSNLQELEILNLFGSDFSEITIPIHLFENLNNLKILNLSNSSFFWALPVGIGKLTNLEELYFDNNNLKSLPDSICQLRNLKVLSLNNNKINDFQLCIFELENLKQLNITNSPFLVNENSSKILKKIKEFNRFNKLLDLHF